MENFISFDFQHRVKLYAKNMKINFKEEGKRCVTFLKKEDSENDTEVQENSEHEEEELLINHNELETVVNKEVHEEEKMAGDTMEMLCKLLYEHLKSEYMYLSSFRTEKNFFFSNSF